MVDMILHFVDKKEQQDKPFYVFSWTQATHHPFEPGPNWENIDFLKGDRTYDTLTWDIARYLNALYELDKQLARLFAELRARKLADDTIVIVTGDHGEAFGWPHSDSVAHSCKCYQEDVNVPMFIWSPALFKSPERSQAYGGHVDLSPTVLDLLGIPSPPSWQGRSLLSPLHPPRAYFYGMREDYLLGVRENQYKYVFNATLGQDELYDVVKDKLEQNNIAAQHPDICKPMRQRLAAWVHYERDH
jgi:arylsulfatase A-like enzyme